MKHLRMAKTSTRRINGCYIVFRETNVFKSRNTGVICPACKNKEIGKNIKNKIENNELSKICNIEQEYKFIKSFQELVKNTFNTIKAFDGCNSDLIFKPNNVLEDIWVGIQVKTTNVRRLTYSFHIHPRTFKTAQNTQ